MRPFPTNRATIAPYSRYSVAKDLTWFGNDYIAFISVLANGLRVEGIGTVDLLTKRSMVPTLGLDKHTVLRLANVLHVPEAACNILGLPIAYQYNLDTNPADPSKWSIWDQQGRPLAYFRNVTTNRLPVLRLSEPPRGPRVGPSLLSTLSYSIEAVWPVTEMHRWLFYQASLNTLRAAAGSGTISTPHFAGSSTAPPSGLFEKSGSVVSQSIEELAQNFGRALAQGREAEAGAMLSAPIYGPISPSAPNPFPPSLTMNMAFVPQQPLHPSNEYAQVVWASHILSYLNPYTCSTTDGPSNLGPVPDIVPGDGDDSENDLDDNLDTDVIIAGEAQDHLAAHGEVIRQKFLNCVAELLAHTKGGKHVAATALREKENAVEVDIASNSPFHVEDDRWLASLSHFLANCGGRRTTAAADGTLYNADDPYRSFLDATVRRNAARLDWWIAEFAKLLKGVNLAPSAATQLLAPDAADELVKLVWLSVLAPATGEPAALARLRMVSLAAVVTESPETASSELKRIVPSIDGSKAAKLCRLIARPAVNLRTLARTAHLFPSFQAIVFIKVKSPGFTRLAPHQIPSLAKAWKQLGLPHLDRLPESLHRRQKEFREDCARDFPVHCDAQLLLRYKAEPSLAPTFPYIGCSKRACFLCHSLLSVLRLQTRVRGHHGVCYPLWGVGVLQSENLRRQLQQLCDIVKEKIVARLSRKNTSTSLLVPQSSAVSYLRTADIAGLGQQYVYREELERRNQEVRERLQIL